MQSHCILKKTTIAAAITASFLSLSFLPVLAATQPHPNQQAPQVSSKNQKTQGHKNNASGQGSKNNPTKLTGVTVVGNTTQVTDLEMGSIHQVDALSAEELEHTAVRNVAEALGLLPGVTVINQGNGYFGGVDGASRGQGMFAAVNGLPSSYSLNLFNGVNIAEGMKNSRHVQLSLLPPSGLQTVAIRKSSTADMQGTAIGGTIDFRTPTAYDFRKPTGGVISVSGRLEGEARKYGSDGLGGGVSGAYHTVFGEQHQFGMYVSFFKDYRKYINAEYAGARGAEDDGDMTYTRQTADGDPAPGYDPLSLLLVTGTDVGPSSGFQRRIGGNASFNWHVNDDLGLYFRFAYTHSQTVQNTTYTQLKGKDITLVQSPGQNYYTPIIGRIAEEWWYETNPEKAELLTSQLGFNYNVGQWTVSSKVFFSSAKNDRPNHIETSAQEDKYSDANFVYGYSNFAAYGKNGFPIPLLTPALEYAVNHIPLVNFASDAGNEQTRELSHAHMGGLKVDLERSFSGGHLSSVKFGGMFDSYLNEYMETDWSGPNIDDGHTLLGDLPYVDGHYDSIYPGRIDWNVPKIDQGKLFEYGSSRIDRMADLSTCGSILYNNLNCDTQRGHDESSSIYGMLTFDFDNFTIIPGLRASRKYIKNTYFVIPRTSASQGDEREKGHFTNDNTSYFELLPSITINYRPTVNAVYRFAYWRAYLPPPFNQLRSGESIHHHSNGVTEIDIGNPDLKATVSDNFNVSGSWSNDEGGYLSIGGYFKKLRDTIFNNNTIAFSSGVGNGPTSTTQVGATVTNKPVNGGGATIKGISLIIRQRFTRLPGMFSGLGIRMNFTRQWTSADLKIVHYHHTRVRGASDMLGNVALTYRWGGFSANVSYHYTGSRIHNYNYLGLDPDEAGWDDLWQRPISRVDLNVGYTFNTHWDVNLSVANLLDAPSYWAHIGENSLVASNIVDAGRTSLLRVSYNF